MTATLEIQPATHTPSRQEALQKALSIDGWLSPREAGVLYDLAREARGPIVEIGSWRGRSTAVLALGAAAGTGQPVFAIDPFVGVPPGSFATAQGERPGWGSCSVETLLENLRGAGVADGAVKVLPTTSQAALPFVPDCDVLFVDGCHTEEAAAADLAGYMPKVRAGGSMVVHDVCPSDPGVVAAVDALLMPAPDWTVLERADRAIVARKRRYDRRQVLLAVPGRGFDFAPVAALLEASRHHDVKAGNNANGWDDFNALWALAMNWYEAGDCTHFAMLHSDVAPESGWLDLLMAEIEDRQADLVSVAIPLKDNRGLTSCGIADPDDRWGPYRRFTMRDLHDLPPTFSALDVRHLGAAPEIGRHLLHNTGCWVCDLRNPLFRETEPDGSLSCWFDFPTRVARNPHDGKWLHFRESEDWFFSRRIAQRGARTFITRKVPLVHLGCQGFPNSTAWGTYREGDRDTQHKWGDREPPAET